jgi:DNA-binding CsgD family transcriptional regulator
MRRGAFHDDERRPLGTLMRHLNRALRMQLRLTETGETAATFGARLARSQIASAVVDRLGRVVVSNGAFEVLLRDKAAPVTLRNGVFSPRCVSKAAVHTNLLGLARDPTARRNEPLPTLALPRTSGAPLILELMPLPPALIEPFDLGPLETASTALFIVDPDATVHPPLDLLRQAFRLSPDEAGLAAEMACGLSADEAGRRLGLDRPRAATLAQTLMRKTAARSEAALIAALARLATGAGR